MRAPRIAWFVLCFIPLFACAEGSGCSGCSSVNIQPIPSGYPEGQRISNVGHFRLTEKGLRFLETNANAVLKTLLPNGLDFAIQGKSCKGGGCFARFDITYLKLTPTAPNRLKGYLQAKVVSVNASGNRAPIKKAAGTDCDLDLNSSKGSRPYVGLLFEISLVNETRSPRKGATKIVIRPTGDKGTYFAIGEKFEDADGKIEGSFLCDNFGDVVTDVQDEVNTEFGAGVDRVVRNLSCTPRGLNGCPAGTYAVPDQKPESICRFEPRSSSDCVPRLIGGEGRGELGTVLLGNVSPGTQGAAQFMMAAGGDGLATDNGLTMFFQGGFQSLDPSLSQSPAHNRCVPAHEPPILPDIQPISVLQSATSHVALAVSQRFLNYISYGIFDSGTLCVAAGPRLSQQLSTGLFSTFIRSIRNLTFPEQTGPLSVVLRPQWQPDIFAGSGRPGDPVLVMSFRDLDTDIYIWSNERHTRVLTFRSDLIVPVDLDVTGGKLTPILGQVQARNPSVSNYELLEERPGMLSTILADLITALGGTVAGSFPSFEIPTLGGVQIAIPDHGVSSAKFGNEDFLTIQANIVLPEQSTPIGGATETALTLSNLKIEKAALEPATWGQGEVPSVQLLMEASGPTGASFEYSYRIDGMQWSPWSENPHVVLQDKAFLFQAKHNIEARSRVAGVVASADPTPAHQELVIDVLPPEVRLEPTSSQLNVRAADIISKSEGMNLRWRTDDGAWSQWATLGAEWPNAVSLRMPQAASQVEVEVRDESGNIGRAQAALIRGLPHADKPSDCGCRVPNSHSSSFSWPTLLWVAALGSLLLARRRGWRK